MKAKGGIPGQVILSQENRSDWLLTNSTDGSLMTEIRHIGGNDQQLQSQDVITDGEWHRVGLVRDGSQRILYADDEEVSRDTQPRLARWPDGLYIGAGNQLESDSFFSGLIDDVRIYNRAVIP